MNIEEYWQYVQYGQYKMGGGSNRMVVINNVMDKKNIEEYGQYVQYRQYKSDGERERMIVIIDIMDDEHRRVQTVCIVWTV